MKMTSKQNRLRGIAAFALVGGVLFAPDAALAMPAAVMNAGLATPRQAPAAAPVYAISGEVPSETMSAPVATEQQTSMVGSTETTSTKSTKSTKATNKVEPSGKTVIDKNPAVAQTEAPKPVFTVTAGWDSKYVFKGFDNVAGSSVERPDDVGIWYGKVGMAYQGFGATIGYLQADQETTPKYNPTGGSDYYSEVILGVNYTAALIGGVLDATVGYNMYLFPNGDYWANDYQGEAWLKLAYVQIPHLTPNITYSYFHADNDVLSGQVIEFRLDSNFDLYDGGSFSVGINPYAMTNLDMDFNADGTNFGGVEAGIRLPVAIGNNLVVALSGSYGWDLGEDTNYYGGRPPKRDGFWGGVSATYKF